MNWDNALRATKTVVFLVLFFGWIMGNAGIAIVMLSVGLTAGRWEGAAMGGSVLVQMFALSPVVQDRLSGLLGLGKKQEKKEAV